MPRTKTRVALDIPPELDARLRKYIGEQPLRVTITAVLEAALREYLDKHAPIGKKRR